MSSSALSALWNQTVNTVKDRFNNRALWETLEQSVAITVDGDQLIIGLDPINSSHAGHLNVAEHRNSIETTATKLAGRNLKLRVIDGTTLADWANTKDREARAAANRTTTYQRKDKDVAEAVSWDEVVDNLQRLYSGMSGRHLPQNRVKYLAEAVSVISTAIDKLGEGSPSESYERMLARAIERVAACIEVPPTVVALELNRFRELRTAG